jgi:hypothetical protein
MGFQIWMNLQVSETSKLFLKQWTEEDQENRIFPSYSEYQ